MPDFSLMKRSRFVPTQKSEWLGILWDSQLFSLSIKDRRISDLLCSITHIIDLFPVFTARELAQVTDKVISLSHVVGNLTRLMTRIATCQLKQGLVGIKHYF
jgi:hypothetical protein